MSRSRRKTPIVGITTADSEKSDKQLASRKARRRVTGELNVKEVSKEDFDLPEHDEHPRSGRWTFSKDGKTMIRPSGWRDLRWLRK